MRFPRRAVMACLPHLLASVALALFATVASADPLPRGMWSEFGVGEIGDFATGRDPADSPGQFGDRFETFDFGVGVGRTSTPLAGAIVDCRDDPEACLGTAGMSTGTFVLGGGAQSLLVRPAEGSSGDLRVRARALPEPGTLVLVAIALIVLGVLCKRPPRR